MCRRKLAFDKKLIDTTDLYKVRTREKLVELLLCLPFLAATVLMLSSKYPGVQLAALPCAFYFYLSGLRQAHGAFHYSLGLNRFYTDAYCAALSVPMLIPLHCVQVNHLIHHRDLLGESDIEGRIAHETALGAILNGPKFYLQLIFYGFMKGNSRQRSWQIFELALICLFIVCSAALAPNISAPFTFILIMVCANCLSGFFAVWTVHRDSADTHLESRSQRGWFKNILVLNMFYHLEHHLYPRIHTSKWPELARRLDPVLKEHDGHKDVY